MNGMNGERNATHKKQAKCPYRLYACKEQALVEIDSKQKRERIRKRKERKFKWVTMDRWNDIAHKKQAKCPYCLHACKEQALVEIDSRETKKKTV